MDSFPFSHYFAFASSMTWVLLPWSSYYAALPKILATYIPHTHTHTHTHTHSPIESTLWRCPGWVLTDFMFQRQYFVLVLRVVLQVVPRFGDDSISTHLIHPWESVKCMTLIWDIWPYIPLFSFLRVTINKSHSEWTLYM